jgi:hypothetical protein
VIDRKSLLADLRTQGEPGLTNDALRAWRPAAATRRGKRIMADRALPPA